MTSRRGFITSTAVASFASVSGCLGGDGGTGDGSDVETVPFLSIAETSGPASELGTVWATAEEDLVNYINDEGFFEFEFEYIRRDAAYDAEEAVRIYDEFTREYDPGFMVGAGAADSLALAERVASDEIPYFSIAETTELTSPQTPYSFISHTSYIDQVRSFLKILETVDPGAKVGMIHADVPGGRSIAQGLEYIQELDLERGDVYALPLNVDTADPQIERAREDDQDYILSHIQHAPHMQICQSANNIHPDLTVVGTAVTASELRMSESPDVFEGHGVVLSTKPFTDAAHGNTRGSEILAGVFERYYDTSPAEADQDVANVKYIQAMNVIDLLLESLEQTIDMGGDVKDGSDVRDGLFKVADYEGWELSFPRTLTPEDHRPATSGRYYTVQGGEMDFVEESSVPRREDWIPEL